MKLPAGHVQGQGVVRQHYNGLGKKLMEQVRLGTQVRAGWGGAAGGGCPTAPWALTPLVAGVLWPYVTYMGLGAAASCRSTAAGAEDARERGGLLRAPDAREGPDAPPDAPPGSVARIDCALR